MGTEAHPEYVAAWRRMRTLDSVRWVVRVVVVLWAALLARSIDLFLVAVFGTFALGLGAEYALFGVPCPRCRIAYAKGFRVAMWFSLLLPVPPRCHGCGLPRGAERDPDAEPGRRG